MFPHQFDQSARNVACWRILALRTDRQLKLRTFLISKMADGRHLKLKALNSKYISNCWTVAGKYGMMTTLAQCTVLFTPQTGTLNRGGVSLNIFLLLLSCDKSLDFTTFSYIQHTKYFSTHIDCRPQNCGPGCCNTPSTLLNAALKTPLFLRLATYLK